ncbi:MAG: 6-phosphofructokinase [Deltaproteobacteria bacterium CG_4_9_14_3_um_filter_63_12]|nr:MAG: 6-phosphofructokinase [Deltaproteobacteria bacterium CG17_big_fil_post_rev_8_21_14_2_50_63_7]PJB35353.1 MAG: 6-phosphofructokinase [Deltaproteobacteria bacterium CG_4_9_14_3_um_filter_63_12]
MNVRNVNGIQRVAIIFAGGPAPGANAVISSAAISFVDQGLDVIGFLHGYENLQNYHPVTHRLLPDVHYRKLERRDIQGVRNARGIMIGTSRANPGKGIDSPADLLEPSKTVLLRNVYNALVDLRIDALISIGGDDTLKTGNKLFLYQQTLPANAKRVRIVHLPKTIDNDYSGIDFTFGFFTAVDWMAKEVQNLRADAIANGSYFIVETMGRKASWISYGVAIAGEAHLVLGVEDVDDSLSTLIPDPENPGEKVRFLDLMRLTDLIVDLIVKREQRDNIHYGIVVLAEGLAELLPPTYLSDVSRDDHGHLSLGKIDLGKLVARLVKNRYSERFGRSKKVTGVQFGYESRCAPAHAFDVILGSQLGIGAFRALVEEGLDGYMVSVHGQLDLHYVPFSDLVNSETLKTEIRFVERGSDFHRLARFLEERTDDIVEWGPGQRGEDPSNI